MNGKRNEEKNEKEATNKGGDTPYRQTIKRKLTNYEH